MEQLVATGIFAVALVVIFSDWLHRTVVALAGAIVMVLAGRILGFYQESEAVKAIDFNTIGLLLGMMVVVALLAPTGFFEYVALQAGKRSHGRPLALFLLLGGLTSALSMFLDNVTTVVVMAPVTLVIGRVLDIHPAPLLVSQAMLANIAGAATLVGDPPNILIGTAASLSFNDFLTHSLPVIALVWASAAALLWLMFRRHFRAAVAHEAPTRDGSPSPEDGAAAEGDPAGSRAPAPSATESAPAERATAAGAEEDLQPSQALKDRRTALLVLTILAGAVVLFFLQEALHVSPAFVALAAAGVALIFVDADVVDTLERVEWSVLIFFTALFVVVGGLEHSGALKTLADVIAAAFGDLSPILLGVVLIWIVAVLSAVVDNIPITIALIPVIAGLESSGISIGALWWALAFGTGVGGNATIIGATANVVVVSVSDRTDEPISSRYWMRYGIPTMLLTTVVLAFRS